MSDTTVKRRYGARRMDLHFWGDLCESNKNMTGGYGCEPLYLAADFEAVVAERDALAAAHRAAVIERDSFVTKAADNMKLYLDLLMQVQNVVPGETRHESARRIIQQHENQSHGPAQCKAAP